jgi:hypothetical protein
LCTCHRSCARFTSPLITFVFNCIHTERILISKSIGATKHVLPICIHIYIYLYIHTNIHQQHLETKCGELIDRRANDGNALTTTEASWKTHTSCMTMAAKMSQPKELREFPVVPAQVNFPFWFKNWLDAKHVESLLQVDIVSEITAS